MKWVLLGIAGLAGVCFGIGAWPPPKGASADERMVSSFYYLIGIFLIGVDIVLWLGYTIVKALL